MAAINEKGVVRKKGGPGRPFAQGVSGNPTGRPKVLEQWRKSEEAQRLRDLSYAALEDALNKANETKDRINAAKELLDRTEGRPAQAIVGGDGGPVKVDLNMVEMLRKLAAP